MMMIMTERDMVMMGNVTAMIEMTDIVVMIEEVKIVMIEVEMMIEVDIKKREMTVIEVATEIVAMLL